VAKIFVLIFVGLLVGCACGGMGQPGCPSLQVTTNPTFLTISGSSYSNIANCAHLSISGFPPPQAVVAMGDPQCINGSFQNFNWQYSNLVCLPSTTQTQSVVVAGVDNSTSTVASQSVSIPCIACGGEGLPVCPGNRCQTGPPDLNPNFQNGQLVCTATCGHAQGYTPCDSSMGPCGGSPPTLEVPQSPCVTKNGNLNDYTCFDGSMIDTFGTCTCVPNTINSCMVNTSVPNPPANDTGTCTRGQFSKC
jgi:hypothetical protein